MGPRMIEISAGHYGARAVSTCAISGIEKRWNAQCRYIYGGREASSRNVLSD